MGQGEWIFFFIKNCTIYFIIINFFKFIINIIIILHSLWLVALPTGKEMLEYRPL